jgi:hypothetical protein
MDDIIKKAVRAKTAEIQRAITQFARQHKGQPVDKVKPAFQRVWTKNGGERLTDSELTEYATHISEGRPIKFKAA